MRQDCLFVDDHAGVDVNKMIIWILDQYNIYNNTDLRIVQEHLHV